MFGGDGGSSSLTHNSQYLWKLNGKWIGRNSQATHCYTFIFMILQEEQHRHSLPTRSEIPFCYWNFGEMEMQMDTETEANCQQNCVINWFVFYVIILGIKSMLCMCVHTASYIGIWHTCPTQTYANEMPLLWIRNDKNFLRIKMSKQMISAKLVSLAIRFQTACVCVVVCVYFNSNLSCISLMVCDRILSHLFCAINAMPILCYEIIEKDKLKWFYAPKMKIKASNVNVCYVWFCFSMRTNGTHTVCVCFDDQIYWITNVLPFIRLSVINSNVCANLVCLQSTWADASQSEIYFLGRSIFITFYLPPNRISSICLSVNQCVCLCILCDLRRHDDWYYYH